VQQSRLPYPTGFFFGESRPEDQADDLRFISTVRQAIKNGYTVFYSSWW